MDALAPTHLLAPTLLTAVGGSVAALWQALQSPPAVPASLAWLPDPRRQRPGAYFLEDPTTTELGVERKLWRTMEKQARLALTCAQQCWTQAPSGSDTRHTGLFMALPMVDEQVPGQAMMDDLRYPPTRQQWADLLLRNTPPFSGLSLLNSSTLAHISARLNLTGATGAFAPFADAGLHALIEGLLSITEGESQAALIGAQSAKLDPAHVLQQTYLGWSGQQSLGEASAFVMARAGAGDSHLCSFGRSGAGDGNLAAALSRAISLAMERAEVRPEQIGWILGSAGQHEQLAEAERQALEHTQARPWRELPACHAGTHTGLCGAALPLIHVLLAQHALQTGARLAPLGTAWRSEPMRERYVLVVAQGPHGQACAVIMTGGTP